MESVDSRLTNRNLAINSIVNLSGFAIVAVVMFLVYPQLVTSLGDARVGLYLLVISIIGYFSFFDLGLNRALTRFLSISFEKGNVEESREILRSGLAFLFIMGVGVSVVLFFVSPVLIDKSNLELYSEAVSSLQIASLAMVFILLNLGMRSVLEAKQEFLIINLIIVPASIFNYIGPLILSSYSNNLLLIVLLIMIGRVIVFLVSLLVVTVKWPGLLSFGLPTISTTLSLVRFGGWLTISRLINPVFLYLDKFVVSASFTLAVVAYYTTPFELTSRMLVAATSFIAVLYPAYSAISELDSERLGRLRNSTLKLGLGGLAAPVFLIIVFANQFFSWWISPEFAVESSLIFQILAVGVLINYSAHFPSTLLQAVNRPDIPAKMHMIELPLYISLLLLMVQNYGIVGAAISWTIRVSIDAAFHFYFAEKIAPTNANGDVRKVKILFVLIVLLLVSGFLITRTSMDIVIVVTIASLVLVAYGVVFWFLVLLKNERVFLLDFLLFRRKADG